jgi:uncharacterized protein YfaS (alpha-2-macroglobulin family)
MKQYGVGFTVAILSLIWMGSVTRATPAQPAGTGNIVNAFRTLNYLPDQPVVLPYSVWPDQGMMHVRLYAVGLARAAELRGRSTQVTAADFDAQTPISTYDVGPGLEPGGRRSVDIGRREPGFYAIVVSGARNTDAQLIDVTTLGIVVNGSKAWHSAWAVDMRTFLHHDGATSVWIAGRSNRSAADASGLAFIAGKQSNDAVVVAKNVDGSVAVERLDGERPWWWERRYPLQYRFPGEPGDGYAQTDRPIYRPGQRVFFRAIVRDGGIGAFTIPRGARRVKIAAVPGDVVYDETLPIDAFGTIHGEARLPDDARLGGYRLSFENGPNMWFSVAAYKKPEVEVSTDERQWVLASLPAEFTYSAKYLFGRPAAGLRVHYTPDRSTSGLSKGDPLTELFPAADADETLPTVATVTGSNGVLKIAVPTKPLKFYHQTLSLTIDGRDDSGRTVTTDTSIEVAPALVNIKLNLPEMNLPHTGDRIVVTASEVDNDNNDLEHMGPIDVYLMVVTWNGDHTRYTTVRREHYHRRANEDPAGYSLPLHLDKTGDYYIAAVAADARGRQVLSYGSFAVEPPPPVVVTPSPEPAPDIQLQKNQFAPGERARVSIFVPEPNRDVLLAVVTDHPTSTQIVHVNGSNAVIDVDVPRDAHRFRVSVQLPTDRGVQSFQKDADIFPRSQKLLTIALAPDRTRFAPGDRAGFTIKTLDASGRPVRASVAIGVVDQALYDVAPGDFTDPWMPFYDRQADFNPRFSWTAPTLVRSGTTTDVYSVNTIASVSGAGANPNSGFPAIAAIPRTNFLDTAYWSATVVTDAKGAAHVSFPWPDNLTTWVAFATAVTADSSFGSAKITTLVSKDFLVRLETPRFLRKNDRSQIVGIANGMADASNVHLNINLGRLAPTPLDATVHLNDDHTASASWAVDAGRDLGDVTMRLAGSDGRRTDAMQLVLPVEADGAVEHVRDAGSLPERSATHVALPPGYDAGTLRIALAPSIVAKLVQNLHVLELYPYYCTEQTMSAALPAVFINRLRHRVGMPADDRKTARMVARSESRLAQLQHPDGSWGWWAHDRNNPFMTSYSVYGLAEFRAAGYPVPETTYVRGVQNLILQLRDANVSANTRAFMLFALAKAAPDRVDRNVLRATYNHAPELNAYALAVLGLAYHELGNDGAARTLLVRLNARSVSSDTFTYWLGPTWLYGWEDDPIETTSYALRLNAALDPHAPIVARVRNFLLAQQRGSWWFTTKDTAAAIYALAGTIDDEANEYHPDETVRISVDGRLLRTVHITKATLNASEADIVIAPNLLHDGSAIDVEREGRGSLYWSSDFIRYAPAHATQTRDTGAPLFERLFPTTPDLSVDRRYTAPHPGPWRVGDEITVDVTVRARTTVEYVAIEDPFPATAEYQPMQGEGGFDWNWSGMQFFDDHATFFADSIRRDQPIHLHYALRVTVRGTYTAPPPVAYAMYGPPVGAVGSPQNIEVTGL